MGRSLSTLGLVVALAGLAGYIYFVDSNRPASGTEVKEKAFGELTGDDIEEIEIKSADGESSRARKTDGSWKLVEPVAADADASELSSIASSAASLEIQRVVDEAATDLKQYGLDPARVEVGFTAKGQAARRILLGEKTPNGSELYARLPDSPRVFLISSYLDSTFNKDTFALRDRTVLKFERDKVDGLELTTGGTTLRFAKSGSDWTIVAPIAARADYGAVEGAVERLASVQMQGITADTADDLRRYGLDAPTATMTVSAGSSRAVLTLGGTENAVVFAKDANRPMVFTVAPTLKSDVIKDLGDFRRKDLFDFRSFTATKIELTRGTETLVLTKSTGKDEKGAETVVWKNAAGADVETTKVEDLLGKVSALRAQSFQTASHPSLAKPVLTVVATFDKGTETVSFGRAGADVFASRTGEPGAAAVEASALDDALGALDALK